ncbi:MAG: phosphatidylserine decarboxylase, partial [Alistipes sp.]|nr:phosphatidylserine decarboxylase [Alistipes sp.]
MKINKEGYKIIAISGVCLAAVWTLLYYMIEARENIWLLILITVLLVAFWFFIVSFFREPRRVKIHDADLVFSPCDGRVVVTEVVEEDEYFEGKKRLQVSIFMSVTNVHINWFPVGGVVN